MRYKILILLLIFFNIYLFSYQWPANKDFLKSLFGSINGNVLQDGIEFRSEGQAIYPLAAGELIYYQDVLSFGDNSFQGNDGNLMVLKHVGEFKSIYRNFSSLENFNYSDYIRESEMIGVSDKNNDNFMFSVYDDKIEAYINPQQLLPYLEDDKSPVISSVLLRSKNNEIKISRNKKLPAGEYLLYINAWDLVSIAGQIRRFSPFSIYVFIDGFERYNISFSSIKEIDESLYLSGESDVSVDKIISGGDLIFGGEIFLTRGRSLIEVVIKDIDGNEASKSYSVIVE